jgi:hypothetical protein
MHPEKGVQMKTLLLTATLLFATSASFAETAPTLSGLWDIHVSVSGNESDEQCKFVVTGDQITGTCKSEGKDRAVTGSLIGDKATWQFETEYEGSPLIVIFKATLEAPGKFDGTVSVPSYDAAGDFTAKPVPVTADTK